MKKHQRLTSEELKAFPGFENYTDEQVEEKIVSLETLSILFYELYQKSLKQNERFKRNAIHIED
jgi:hypothetical protein